MKYNREQLVPALFLIHELQEIEKVRGGQKNPIPWVQREEAIKLMASRLTWPAGTAAWVIDQLAETACIRKSPKAAWIIPLLPLVPENVAPKGASHG